MTTAQHGVFIGVEVVDRAGNKRTASRRLTLLR